jgi:hypothetical protein
MLYPVFSAEKRKLVRVVMWALVSWLLLGPPAAEAGRDVVIVEDYSSALWDGIVAKTVDDFNAVMPRGGPRLVYERRAAVLCDALPRRRGKNRHITVCSTTNRVGGQVFGGKRIELGDAFADETRFPGYRAEATCHEFMHILTRIPDNYDTSPESCVWGRLTAPGPFDVATLEKVYGKKTRR